MNETSTISIQPMTWQDNLLLLSPITWFGFLHQLHRSPFVEFRVDQLCQGLLGLLLPFLALSFSNLDPRLVLPLSPWAIGIFRKTIHPHIKQIYNTLLTWKTKRSNPLLASQLAYAHCIASGRCIRCGRFDIFLPKHTFSGHALLWLPGALMAHTAYSDVAAQLSDNDTTTNNICVVTVSMEPCRMASPFLGATPRRLKRIQKRVEGILTDHFQHERGHPVKMSWSIGGHSLGSFAAMAMAEELGVSSLIMWGSANFRNTRTDLSRSSIPTLVVQGSRDKLCVMDEVALSDFRKDFPPNTIYTTIEGGSHNGFASVEPGDPLFLGAPTISMEQQQQEAVAITAKFLAGLGITSTSSISEDSDR